MDYTQGQLAGAEAHAAHPTKIAWPILDELMAQAVGCPSDVPDEYRRGWIDGFNECADAMRASVGLLRAPRERKE